MGKSEFQNNMFPLLRIESFGLGFLSNITGFIIPNSENRVDCTFFIQPLNYGTTPLARLEGIIRLV